MGAYCLIPSWVTTVLGLAISSLVPNEHSYTSSVAQYHNFASCKCAYFSKHFYLSPVAISSLVPHEHSYVSSVAQHHNFASCKCEYSSKHFYLSPVAISSLVPHEHSYASSVAQYHNFASRKCAYFSKQFYFLSFADTCHRDSRTDFKVLHSSSRF